ncbi:hypothetical protein KZZ52_25520 [Dactylosporangium sp. AC04546]|uniref:hypothetical protein n=1 Tax=Dactylosporangium sp. AC04546 TaxID=2862460 RepID=UPI001EE149CF|nr:hypothetical protein [Dactylosporangium sp. AC04546]WVK88631.1 hypothetical protein KZZ52_25520 [Dactylosporangium sp. AC04546]
MRTLPWRDGARELRRLVAAAGGDPDHLADVDLAWHAFRAFLAVPLDGLYDRWEGTDVEADTLVVEFPVADWPDGPPGLLLARRFAVPAVEWHDGVPGRSPDDGTLDLADTVQVELELTFPRGTTGDADEFWTAARSGEFDSADLAEAEELVTGLALGRTVRSRIALESCN